MKVIGILIGMTMIVLAIYYIYRIKKDVKAEEVSEVHIDNHKYRDYVCQTVQNDFKPYFNDIIQKIDEINSVINRNNLELSQESYNAMTDVYNKADEVERLITLYWKSSQFNKDFSFYIGLHYSSHMLGNAIKQEQQAIKNNFVECKTIQKQWGDKIDNLKVQKQKASGKKKLDISKEIGVSCVTHKRISNLASSIGRANTLYNNRVSQQCIKTAKRRDFIAENFGTKGRNWKMRMDERTLKKRGVVRVHKP